MGSMIGNARTLPRRSAGERIEDLLWAVLTNCITAFVIYVAAVLGGFLRPSAWLFVVGGQLIVGCALSYTLIRKDNPVGLTLLLALAGGLLLVVVSWALFLAIE
ncbi:MAG: hypothetical protein ACRDQB_03435 [Thermocrispum sp.]